MRSGDVFHRGRCCRRIAVFPTAPTVAAIGFPARVPRPDDRRARRDRSRAGASTPTFPAPTLAALLAGIEPGAIALENALRVQRAEALSVTDDLTQLYNSRLPVAGAAAGNQARVAQRPAAVAAVPRSRRVQVDQRHARTPVRQPRAGRSRGVIRASARETDMVARFGGDEFALILPDTGSEGAAAVGERVRERIAAFTVSCRRRPGHQADRIGRRRDAPRRRGHGGGLDPGGR